MPRPESFRRLVSEDFCLNLSFSVFPFSLHHINPGVGLLALKLLDTLLPLFTRPKQRVVLRTFLFGLCTRVLPAIVIAPHFIMRCTWF